MKWIRERLREMREERDRLKVIITAKRRAIEYEQRRIIEYVLAGGSDALYKQERQQKPPDMKWHLPDTRSIRVLEHCHIISIPSCNHSNFHVIDIYVV